MCIVVLQRNIDFSSRKWMVSIKSIAWATRHWVLIEKWQKWQKWKKIVQKNWISEWATNCLVSWISIIYILYRVLDSASNGIGFKIIFFTKSTVKLRWSFGGFSTFSPNLWVKHSSKTNLNNEAQKYLQIEILHVTVTAFFVEEF